MNHPENDKRNLTNCDENQTERKGKTADPVRGLDELVLDRLVDNDLNPEEYKAVLKLVEEKPDGWRRLAIAFLESQALENELSGLRLDDSYVGSGVADAMGLPVHADAAIPDFPATEVEGGQDNTLKQPAVEKSVSDERPTAQVPGGPLTTNRGPERELQTNRRGSTFLRMTKQAIPAIAACLVIAAIATVYVREMRDQRNDLENVVTLPSSVNSKQNSSDDPNQNYIQLVGNNDGESMRAPVYDHETFDQKEAAAGFAKFTPRLREVLTSSGLNANERTHVMPIKDSEGNKIILPIKEFKLTPTKWEGYQ